MSIFQTLGNVVDYAGTALNLPDWGLSEGIAGGPTANTGRQTVGYENLQPASYNYTPTQATPTSGSGTYNPPAPQNTGGFPSNPAVNEFYNGYRWTGNEWAPPPGGGGGGQPDYAAEARSAIESGYSTYEQQLDAMLNEGLPGQQTALETQASAQLQRGQADILSQKQEGQTFLGEEEARAEKGKTRTLKDIYGNLRNSFMAGNVYLGAQGAGDSSASGMLNYALNKVGSKQTGDVISQFNDIKAEISTRKSRIDEIYNKEKNNLAFLYEEKIGAISQWFYDQQNALRQQKGQLGVSKGQDLASLSQNLLNVALQEMRDIKAQAAEKQNALESWAFSNSTTVQQAQQKLAEIAQYQSGKFQAPPLPGIQMGGGSAPAAYNPGSVYQKEERSIFGGGTSRGYGASGGW